MNTLSADEEFSRQVMQCACSASDLNGMLENVGQWLKKHMPVDRIELFVQSINPASLQVQAEALLGTAPPHRRTIFMTRDFVKYLSSDQTFGYDANANFPRVMRVNDLGEYPSVVRYFGMSRAPDLSYLYVPLPSSGQHRYLSIQATGKHRYTKEHIHLAGLLSAPFTAALARIETKQHRSPVELTASVKEDEAFRNRNQAINDVISGFNKGLAPVLALVRHVAPRDTAVLILGETGVGKELVANAVHLLSSRLSSPFIKVNCGAIPESLLESELFGYERGAFTGAYSSHQGLFAQANGGTIFLDEIGELPLPAQVRLLRVLQFGEIAMVGGKSQQVDIRVIAATHCNLRRMVKLGTFREDLWFRLNVFPIRVPPVRERPGDLEELCMHIIAKKCHELKIAKVPALDAATLDRMQAYHWPGNVRELENVLERALIINPCKPIPEWSQEDTPESMATEASTVLPATPTAAHSKVPQNVLISLDEAIKRHIVHVLHYTRGKIDGTGGAAEILQINPATLRSRMTKLGIHAKLFRG